MKFTIITSTAILLSLITSCASAEDTKYKVSTGLDYSRGSYGATEDTETWYAPLNLKASRGQWSGKITIPYITIKGPGTIIGGGGQVINSGTSGAITTKSGLGDVVASATYTYDITEMGAYVDVTGKIKLPTADEKKGLGTGEVDYTSYLEATKTIGKGYVYLGAGYKIMGDNSSMSLNNVWMTSLGGGYEVSEATSIGAAYDYKQAASKTGDDPSEVSAYINQKITKDVNLQVYGVTGFSDGSPDTGLGIQLGYKL